MNETMKRILSAFQFVLIPTIGSFGLIFKDSYIALGLTATDISLITNVNAAVGMSMGLINGPLLKRFGCRPVGICAGLLMSGGFALTAGAASMTAFIVSYGVVTGKIMMMYTLEVVNMFTYMQAQP